MNPKTAPTTKAIAAQIIKISTVVSVSLLKFANPTIIQIKAQMEHSTAEINAFFLSFIQSSPSSNSSYLTVLPIGIY